MTTSSFDSRPGGFDRELALSSAETLRAKRLQLATPADPLSRGWAPLEAAMADAICNPPTRISDVLAIQVTLQVGVVWPEFLEMLDVEFAKRYFRALDLWNRNDADTPDVWEVLFRRASDLSMSELIAAMLGVNAHINHDLALALISTWEQLGPPKDETVAPDYLLVNKIFYEEIKPLRRGFSDDWQMALDRMVGPLDDWSQRILVKVTRARAWDQALRLWPLRDDPADFEVARQLMDRAASLLGEWMIFGDQVVNDSGDLVTGGWHLFRRILGPGHKRPVSR
jgi:hypothetical protein